MADNLTVRYTSLSDLLLWDRNPKRHDLGAIAESMTRYGFKDPPKYEPLLNNGKGGIVEGNGRIEALQWMRQQGQHAPRGIVSDDSGEWLVPVLYGVDAASEASAAAYGVDHNNLVLSGGDFTAVDVARLWDSQAYAALVSELAAGDEVPESIGDDAVSALIVALEGTRLEVDLSAFSAPENKTVLYRFIVDGLTREEAEAMAGVTQGGRIEQYKA